MRTLNEFRTILSLTVYHKGYHTRVMPDPFQPKYLKNAMRGAERHTYKWPFSNQFTTRNTLLTEDCCYSCTVIALSMLSSLDKIDKLTKTDTFDKKNKKQ